MSFIECHGVRTHNLKNLSLSFPIYKITLVTGVSGSGKSSLVFDTVFAEAQRRFLETLGTYERQFLQGLPKGEFDSIENIPAAIALKQENRAGRDGRSTIATASDIQEPLKNLFIGLMGSACAHCGNPIQRTTPRRVQEMVQGLWKNSSEVQICASFPELVDEKRRALFLKGLLAEGYRRVLDPKFTEFDLESAPQISSKWFVILESFDNKEEDILPRIEKISNQLRLNQSFSSFFIYANNHVLQRFFLKPHCAVCEKETEVIRPADLDWTQTLGSCPKCDGLGNIPVLDETKIVPDQSKSLLDHAVKTWDSETFKKCYEGLIKEAARCQVRVDVPYSELNEKEKQWLWFGTKKGHFYSLKEFFEILEKERYKHTSRILLAKYRKYVLCPDCKGARLGAIGRLAKYSGKSYVDLFRDPLSETLMWIKSLKGTPQLSSMKEIHEEVMTKMSVLERLGLGTSFLFRRCKTLSGGEYQRVLLSRVIGNGLSDALYVLDEPSVGLGDKEIGNLLSCLLELRDQGNTILIVEHDKNFLSCADHVIELGPGGGVKNGGFLMNSALTPVSMFPKEEMEIKEFVSLLPFKAERKEEEAPQAEDKASKVSKTKKTKKLDDAVKTKKVERIETIRTSQEDFFPQEDLMVVEGFSALCCENIDIPIALHRINLILGASGVGKSTVLNFGIEAALLAAQERNVYSCSEEDLDSKIGTWKKFRVPKGILESHEIVSLEQRAVHRSITSIPATLLGLMDYLRKQFAQESLSKELDLTISDFSFNGAGACETCQGRGTFAEDLFFLGQVEKVCDVCEGARFKQESLRPKWLGKNIYEWLSLPMEEAYELLRTVKTFQTPLRLVCDLGIGHLPLGISSSLISGGEAQRLKIAAVLTKSKKKMICLLDEPSRGLSEYDIQKLLGTFQKLSEVYGHTFVIVEHHKMFQNVAHHIMHIGDGLERGRIVKREARLQEEHL